MSWRAGTGGRSLPVLLLLWLGAARAEPGFTAPRHLVELAAPELAAVAAVHVEPGDRVAAGQVLFELDSRALEASLTAADARRGAKGELAASQARQRLRQEQLVRLEAAAQAGHAQPSEVAVARAEADIAAAEVAAARERLAIAALEYERIAVELERRRVRSPLDATVVEVNQQPGEVVSPGDNVLAVLAVLDPLVIRVNLPVVGARALRIGQAVSASCPDAGPARSARLARRAPTADPATATVALEFEIDNPAGDLLSGIACELGL